MTTRLKVWEYWHCNSYASTLTSRPAQLRLSDKAKIQAGLEFVDTITIIMKRNKPFYQSHWFITNKMVKELYLNYIKENSIYEVSYGTFLALKPFYVRSPTTKDMEMCVCKKHLHAKWAINALINSVKLQKIDIPDFVNYEQFMAYLYEDCNKIDNTYIDWKCTPHKKFVCEHITKRWNELKDLTQKQIGLTVPFQYFDKLEVSLKSGKVVKQLKPVYTQADAISVISFIEDFLPKFIHHRNQLKNYRSTIHNFHDKFDAVFIDIDFSENLKIPIKYEPQSLHWSHEQLTVHSGILKFKGEKFYHPYVSNDRKHDPYIVEEVLHQMLTSTDIENSDTMIIESDNCLQQYKSATHFGILQEICNKYVKKIIRVYSIAEHRKGEVDHVGGLAKTAVRRAVSSFSTFSNASDVVDFLIDKFGEIEHPKYVIKEIDYKTTDSHRDNGKFKSFHTIDGSNAFQVMVFQPGSNTVKAANRLCLCDVCNTEYGSCPLFNSYHLESTV